MKTEQQIYDEYCDKKGITGLMEEKWIDDIKDSYGFCKFVLFVRVQEFKNELVNQLPKGLRRFF